MKLEVFFTHMSAVANDTSAVAPVAWVLIATIAWVLIVARVLLATVVRVLIATVAWVLVATVARASLHDDRHP